MASEGTIVHIGLKSQIVNIATVLDGAHVYRTPALQRPFEWGETQVGDMVGDLRAAHVGGYRYYFLGHIVLVVTPSGVRYVVDGQQRLTTFTLLLAFLRDRLAPMNPKLGSLLQACILRLDQPLFTPRASDQAFFRDHVQTPERILKLARADVGAIETKTDAQVLIVQAVKMIHAMLDSLAFDALAKFAEFILHRAIVDMIHAEDRSAAAILFRGMNIRGKPLSTADLIKSDMVGDDELSEEEMQLAADKWEDLEDGLGRDDFSHFLEMAPVLTSGATTQRPGDLAEWRANTLKTIDVRTFLMDLLPNYGRVYRQVRDGEFTVTTGDAGQVAALNAVNNYIRGLLFLEETHWMGPAVYILSQSGLPGEFLERYFRGLDRLSFACFLNAVRHEERADRFAKIIRAERAEDRLFGNGNVFSLRPHEKTELRERLGRPFTRDTWRRRAIAFRINAALPGGRNFFKHEDVTLEHVLPQALNAEWRAAGWTADQHKKCANLVGNFAAVTKLENALADGRLYTRKVDIFTRPDMHPMTAQLLQIKDWTPDGVRARTQALTKALLTHWRIDEDKL
jgi:hypothetical protein